MSDPVFEGGCLCGAVRYRASGEPSLVCFCHCRLCQRASGAPVVPWASFSTERVEWTAGRPTSYASSTWAIRGFCARCGTPLTFQFNDRPESIDLTLASLDRPQALKPNLHIHTSSRVEWLTLSDDLPAYPGPPPKPQ